MKRYKIESSEGGVAADEYKIYGETENKKK